MIEALRTAGAITVAGLMSVVHHWMLALFSLVASFGVWFAVQDLDNPRVEGDAPRDGGIQVVAVNVPQGYAVEDLTTVRVRVDARQSDLLTLRASDFKAEVDVDADAIQRGRLTQTRRVKVESRRGGVNVVQVVPPTIDVSVIAASTKDVPITLRRVNREPDGFRDSGTFTVTPGAVTVSGRKDLVDRVSTVELEVNLANARDVDYVVEGDLVARASDGNVLQVAMSQTRARATLKIDQVFSPRLLALFPQITGAPAAGYIVTNISVDPPVVLATGEKPVIDSLRGAMNLEKLDVTGARQSITVTRQIDRPPNVSTDRPSAVVRVEIQAIDCGTGLAAACQQATFFVAPIFESAPVGLRVEGLTYTVQVHVSGPLERIAVLKPADFKATISLAGATAGAGIYVAKLTAPVGIRVDSVEPLALTLLSGATLVP